MIFLKPYIDKTLSWISLKYELYMILFLCQIYYCLLAGDQSTVLKGVVSCII